MLKNLLTCEFFLSEKGYVVTLWDLTICSIEPVQGNPTVVIRRVLADIQKGDSAKLECAARGLPSGELSVTFMANDLILLSTYVEVPKGQGTLTEYCTVPKQYQTKDKHFTCQIQQSRSKQWKSVPTGNIFGEEYFSTNPFIVWILTFNFCSKHNT